MLEDNGVIQLTYEDMAPDRGEIFREVARMHPSMMVDDLPHLSDDQDIKVDNILYTTLSGYALKTICEMGYLLEATYGWWWASKVNQDGKPYKTIQVQRTNDENPSHDLFFLLREVLLQERRLK